MKSGWRSAYHETVSYHETVRRISRFGAFPTAALTARGAVETTAPPTPRNRLQRIAYQLSHKKNFDHSLTHRPAHDPPKCARFGDKIMRLLKESAIGRKTGPHFC
jgi:hypothetical protein